MAAVAATATVGVLPGFALGAMAGPIRADLHLSLTTIGLAMSAFYATTALTSLYTKRLAVRLPAPAADGLATTAAAAMAAISQTQTLPVMLGGLLAAGIMNGLVQPVAGRVIAAQVPARRRSLTARVVGAALR